MRLRNLVAAIASAGALLPATARADAPPLAVSYTATDISITNHQWYITGTTATTSTLATTGVATFSYPSGTSRHDVTFTSTLKPTCQIAGTDVLNPPYTVPNPPRGAPWTASCEFDTPGTYTFLCTVHPTTMLGSVTVTGSSVRQPVSGTAPATLSLGLAGGGASLGTFLLGVPADYTASLAASVTSTAGDATLTAGDPSATAPGHVVNGTYVMAQALQVRATNAANPSTSFAPLAGTASPLTLLTWAAPITGDAIALEFKQSIGATDPLRTGAYTKSLVFTLSTTNP